MMIFSYVRQGRRRRDDKVGRYALDGSFVYRLDEFVVNEEAGGEVDLFGEAAEDEARSKQRKISASPSLIHGEDDANLPLVWLKSNENRGVILAKLEGFGVVKRVGEGDWSGFYG